MITTYSDFRQRLKTHLDKVVSSSSRLFVTRTKGENIVVLSESEYEGIMETFHLLRSPKNAQRLLNAIEQYNEGKVSERDLIEE